MSIPTDPNYTQNYPTDFRYGERKQGDTPLHSENYNQGYATEYKSPLVMKSGEQIHNGNNGRWVCAHCNNTNYSNKSVCDYCRAARHGNDNYGDPSLYYYNQAPMTTSQWTCPKCNKLNYSYFNECERCGTFKPYDGNGYNYQSNYNYNSSNMPPNAPISSSSSRYQADGYPPYRDSAYGRNKHMSYYDVNRGKEGDWLCNKCGEANFSYRVVCRKCGTDKPAVITDPRSVERYRSSYRSRRSRRRSPSSSSSRSRSPSRSRSHSHSISSSRSRRYHSSSRRNNTHNRSHRSNSKGRENKNVNETEPMDVVSTEASKEKSQEILDPFLTKRFFCSPACTPECNKKTIHVYHLPLEVTEEQLVALFSTIGEVEKDASVDENDTHPHYQITILKNEETQEAIGEAIVVYVDPSVAHRALAYFNNYEYQNSPLYVCMQLDD